MATASKKRHASPSRDHAGRIAPDRASLAFVISQDNDGGYLWEIVDGTGRAIAHSGGFASRDEAEHEAHYVHDSARLAHFAPRKAEQSPIVRT